MTDKNFEYFSGNHIALGKEIHNHPELLEQLSATGSYQEQIGTVAAYCGVVLDGAYMPHELDFLFGKLYDRLVAKRGGIEIS